MNIFYVFIVVCIGVCLGKDATKEEIHKIFLDNSKACQDKVGATEDDVKKLFNGSTDLNRETKCLQACMMQQGGLMTESGKMIIEGVKKHAEAMTDNQDQINTVVQTATKCASSGGSGDNCEKAANYHFCMVKGLTV